MTKATRADYEEHVRQWAATCQAQGRKWWPQFAYHFTDVQNAAGILQQGVLWSRDEAQARGLMKVDNASKVIMQETSPAHTKFARLYFRPRTPTQYHNEGILAPHDRTARYGYPNCPVPVFFCLSLVDLLCTDGAQFSNGSMGRAAVKYGDTRELLHEIPFELVYHDGPIDPSRHHSPDVVFHRHAEVLVPRGLPLTAAAVLCRSAAERQTLINLAGPSLSQQWQASIHVVGDPLFYRDRAYLETVHSEREWLVLRLNIGRRCRGAAPTLHVHVKAIEDSRSWEWHGDCAASELRLRFPETTPKSRVRVWIYDSLAYQDVLDFSDDVPF